MTTKTCETCGSKLTWIYTRHERGWRCRACEQTRGERIRAISAQVQAARGPQEPCYLSSHLSRNERAAQQHTRRWRKDDETL